MCGESRGFRWTERARVEILRVEPVMSFEAPRKPSGPRVEWASGGAGLGWSGPRVEYSSGSVWVTSRHGPSEGSAGNSSGGNGQRQ